MEGISKSSVSKLEAILKSIMTCLIKNNLDEREKYVYLGGRLILAKTYIPRGNFHIWCKKELGFSKPFADQLIRLKNRTKEYNVALLNLSASTLMRVCSLPDEDLLEKILDYSKDNKVTVRKLNIMREDYEREQRKDSYVSTDEVKEILIDNSIPKEVENFETIKDNLQLSIRKFDHTKYTEYLTNYNYKFVEVKRELEEIVRHSKSKFAIKHKVGIALHNVIYRKSLPVVIELGFAKLHIVILNSSL